MIKTETFWLGCFEHAEENGSIGDIFSAWSARLHMCLNADKHKHRRTRTRIRTHPSSGTIPPLHEEFSFEQ